MKDQTIIEMKNKLETLAKVLEMTLGEINHLKTIAVGDHHILKKMPGFEQAVKELEAEHVAAQNSENKDEPKFEMPIKEDDNQSKFED